VTAPANSERPEAWLRGPVEGVDPYLPAAHGLIQVREDLARAAAGLTREQLWARPGSAASVGFHLRHIAGSVDRLLAYARGESLTPAQRAAATAEKELDPALDVERLVAGAAEAVERALAQMRATPREALLEPRAVGRAGLPSTVLGLLFHLAEHAQRHTGQVIATAKAVQASPVREGARPPRSAG
jgi:uncharacterized damage-inducible protein DinB